MHLDLLELTTFNPVPPVLQSGQHYLQESGIFVKEGK